MGMLKSDSEAQVQESSDPPCPAAFAGNHVLNPSLRAVCQEIISQLGSKAFKAALDADRAGRASECVVLRDVVSLCSTSFLSMPSPSPLRTHAFSLSPPLFSIFQGGGDTVLHGCHPFRRA
jgi:hypothetical protein